MKPTSPQLTYVAPLVPAEPFDEWLAHHYSIVISKALLLLTHPLLVTGPSWKFAGSADPDELYI